MYFVYTFLIRCYTIAISLLSVFNKKACLWVSGRKGVFQKMTAALADEKVPLIWVHASSLGEFEQGRPLIEKLKKEKPQYKILLTFFSPSGYEIRKNYKGADYIFYLPADTPANARKFLDISSPVIAIFIKYEYWFNYLKEIKKRQLPCFFVSAIFAPGHYFFKFYGKWSLEKLKNVTHFFVQDEKSRDLLLKHDINNVTVSGDTRFDRVVEITKRAKDFIQVEAFAQNHKVFIAGSTWPEDDSLILDYIQKKSHPLKYIIAPHSINDAYISRLKNKTVIRTCLFSELTTENAGSYDVLIVDGIGYLSHLYKYGHIAYIGGGFGKGIHNILEAACWGLPVVFGPRYKKFREAVELINKGAAFSVSNFRDLENRTEEMLKEDKYYKQLSDISKNYVINKSGATNTIVEHLTTKYLH